LIKTARTIGSSSPSISATPDASSIASQLPWPLLSLANELKRTVQCESGGNQLARSSESFHFLAFVVGQRLRTVSTWSSLTVAPSDCFHLRLAARLLQTMPCWPFCQIFHCVQSRVSNNRVSLWLSDILGYMHRGYQAHSGKLSIYR
jgi:hypothetical protein